MIDYLENEIIVSVFILTYNQENYIGQTLKSVLNQKTNFAFQVVIGEDFSFDDTRKICEEYAILFPDKIKLLPSLEKNIGLIDNYMRTIMQCTGKYIAICDGDDYWIDDLKLQKQVDFLENNPKFSLVHSGVRLSYCNGVTNDIVYNDEIKLRNFNDLIAANLIYSVTVLFRNVIREEKLPQWILKYPYGDWQTYLWVIKDDSEIGYLKDITAVYRKNIGISSRLVDSKLINIEILKELLNDQNFNLKSKIILNVLENKENELMCDLIRDNSKMSAFFYFLKIGIFRRDKKSLVKLYLYAMEKNRIKSGV